MAFVSFCYAGLFRLEQNLPTRYINIGAVCFISYYLVRYIPYSSMYRLCR